MGIFRFFVCLFLLLLSSASFAVDTDNDGILSLGAYYSCALDDTGVVCWGKNENGETDVPSLSNPRQVYSGQNHNCAFDDTGLVCWGNNDYGQIDFPSLSNPTQVSLGYLHSCALDDTGVVCWGQNGGSGITDVPPLSNPTQVYSGGYHNCALDDNGLVCWGVNGDGQTDVPTLVNPTEVSLGMDHSCAIDDTGLVCWGANDYGKSNVPTLASPSQVSLGMRFSCALDDTGVVCWGYNEHDQSNTTALINPTQVSSGIYHICAHDDSGVVCWGYNYYGQTDVPELSFTTAVDNCPDVDNPDQLDTDGDSIGDACDTDADGVSNSEDDVVIDRNAIMTNLVDNVFIPNYKSTAESSASFASNAGALADYCGAIGTAEEAGKKTVAQTAWHDLMDKVQQTEIHIVGPALRNDGALQSRIHPYTTGNLAKCAVDQSVIQLNESTDFSVAARALNQRGMRAMEYLLFNDNMNHSCSSQVIAISGWNALSETERKTQRCNLALELADDVAYASQSIYDQWTDADSPYRTEFLAESSRNENFQQITDALFYIESYTKSGKLAIPLGLDPKCSGMTCPDLVESPYSESSLRNVKVNTQEFLRIFNGDSGVGFDDLIADAGFAEIANRFKTQSADVINKIDEIQTSLSAQLATISSSNEETHCVNAYFNPDYDSALSVCSLAGLLKRITDDLKIEFVTVVNVPVPGKVQSDNDDHVDSLDNCPNLDNPDQLDTDGDLIGDACDPDADNDGFEDTFEIHNGLDPLVANPDIDNDGIANELDTDNDNDGTQDSFDALPLDPSEQLDHDNDGVGNNADTDDDGDGVNDALDLFSLDAFESADSDGDGVGDNADFFPNSAEYSLDSDLDQMPDAWERKYGLNPSDASDALLDQDNDGMTALEEYEAGTIPLKILDIDANGSVDALTDGLIILRYLFGLRGDNLVNSATASDAMRNDAADVEAYIESLMPGS